MKEVTRIIFCCNCNAYTDAVLTDGKEIYPHRKDLYLLPFWKCDCGGFVGCHHKTKDRTKPLGVIPTPLIKEYRKKIHAVIDPLWRSKKIDRGEIYRRLTKVLGREYHTADLRTEEEAVTVLTEAFNISGELTK